MSVINSLESIKPAEIDDGTFKYVLIKVSEKKEATDGKPSHKTIVRGYTSAPYHSDIFEPVEESCQKAGLKAECLGGGRIEHRPDKSYIKVYGYSQGYGAADHNITKAILAETYKNYEIEVSFEGY